MSAYNEKELIEVDFFRYRHVFIVFLLATLVGCTQQQGSQDLKEQTAQATADVKRDAKLWQQGSAKAGAATSNSI